MTPTTWLKKDNPRCYDNSKVERAKVREDTIEECLEEAIEIRIIVWSEGPKAQAPHLLTASPGRPFKGSC
uniref:Uncharacterized protein n=1 Tax=Romanomermis culicivorax TaxID=13658 RepID=A0A915K130_ROMCU